MKYKDLGRTSLRVSELCLGTMVFGEEGSRGTDASESKKIIKKFIDEGGNFIDTADVYSKGISEKIVGEAVKEYREDLVIATKCRFPMGDTPNKRGLSRKYIRFAVDASLKRLDTNYIDILYLHGTAPNLTLEDTLHVLNDLVSEGKIYYIGVSNFRAWELMKALSISNLHGWIRFQAAQYQYSLVERNIEPEFNGLFLAENLSSIPWGPLGGGFLTGKYKYGEKPTDGRISVMPDHTEESWENRSTDRNWKIIETIQKIHERTQKSYSQIALRWLMNRPTVTAPIIGVRTLNQLEDNLGVIGWDLSSEDMNLLNNVSEPVIHYPYRFINNYCLD